MTVPIVHGKHYRCYGCRSHPVAGVELRMQQQQPEVWWLCYACALRLRLFLQHLPVNSDAFKKVVRR